MSDFDYKEKRFEQDIEEYLLTTAAIRRAIPPHSIGKRRWTPARSSPSSVPASPNSGSGLRKFMALTVSGS